MDTPQENYSKQKKTDKHAIIHTAWLHFFKNVEQAKPIMTENWSVFFWDNKAGKEVKYSIGVRTVLE